ncbi:cytochrome P450 [Actinophytocola oryzae]|uniref:Cytochrome P450 n=1 Tax=Actinophytocola oryzae TaxID=502181 RepID=A0A4R7VZZ0_9PSEU|nr:cytochrome P450 [Actinophytocola oryzae]TDV55365.1 cytochrome P450 [Actinophytocola oryzae]
MTSQDAAVLRWDPYDVDIATDPYPVYRRLREEKPLYYNETHDFHAVSRFADCERGLADWRTFSSHKGDILELIKSGMEIPPGSLIFEDPPMHDIRRKLLMRIFTQRRIAALEPKIRDFTHRVLEPLVGKERFDLVGEVANQVPMRVIGMLMGIPESEQEAVRDSADESLRTEAGAGMDFRGGAVLSNEIFTEYIDWRRGHPSDDVVTEMLTAEFEDEHGERRTLTPAEILTYTTVVAGAGNETTGRLIGWMGSTFASHPAQRRDVVENPGLVPAAIEEILRMEPPGGFIARFVTTDVELHGETVPAGSTLLLLIAAANRDPRRFEDPDAFDVHRASGQRLTFGHGVHYCLGAALARLEGRIVTEEVLKRFPEWEVDWEHAKLAQTSTVRGWETLPLLVG